MSEHISENIVKLQDHALTKKDRNNQLMVECVYVKDELKRQTKKFCGFKQSQYAYQKI